MEIRLISPGGAPLVLAGTGRAGASELRLSFTDAVQVQALLRARSARVVNRGTRLYALAWSTAREHGSQAAAEAFLLTHAESLPRAAGTLILIGGGGAGGGTSTTTLAPAVVRIAESSARGRTTFHRYEAQGAAE